MFLSPKILSQIDKILYSYSKLSENPKFKDIKSINFEGERINPFNVSREEFLIHLKRYFFALNFIKKNDFVIDGGCGVGYGTDIISRYCKNSIGYEISEDSFKFSKLLFPNLNIQCQNLSKIEQKADVIILFEIIEHLDDWISGLIKMISLSKRNVVFSVPYNQPDGLWKWHKHFEFTEYKLAQAIKGLPDNIMIDFFYQNETGGISKHPCNPNDNISGTSIVAVVTK